MTIVNDDSSIVNKLRASLTDNARVIIYDLHVFIVQATGCPNKKMIKTTFDLGLRLNSDKIINKKCPETLQVSIMGKSLQ
jgi:hypothetical protein